ncbi:MAG: ABC transporter permease, partial [Balneolaceae bacterium]|nr:ABC transporter permease [Balneolaceae bacterium]
MDKHQGLEPGFVEELESHLRDKIESLLNQGYSEKEAYHKAVSSISETGEIAEEYAIARTRGKVRPPWKNRFWIPTLLPNFLKTAFRNFWRQKSIASLNIMGLALGIICCIFISLYIWDELRFDAFHSNADRIFRVVETTDTESGSSKSAYVTNALGPAAEKTIPEVSRATRVFPGWRLTVGPVESALIVRNYHIVDGEFLTIFDFPLKFGSKTEALAKPGSVVLSSEMAQTLFGEENPVGESIRIEAEDFPEFGDQGFTVTGVLKTLPENSHLGFRLLLSKSTIERFPGWNNYFESWTGEFGAAYLLLDNHEAEQQVEAALQQLLAVNLSGENAAKKKLELQPLKEIHFY